MANVNIDFITTAGTELAITGDTTAANGTFAIQVPAGTYEITYTPPAGSGLAGTHQTSVTIIADTDLSPAVLPYGYEVAFQAVTLSGVPAPGIKVDFTNASNVQLFTPANTSNSSGTVQTVIPQTGGPYNMKLKDVGGRGWADKEFINVAPTGNTSYGPIVIGPARSVSGRTIRYSNAAAVAGVDFDIIDACGLELKLSSDTTTATGGFNLLGVCDGIYQIIVRPPGATGLARREFRNVRIGANYSFGDIKLGTEHSISGTVVNTSATPLVGIDLNLTDEAYAQQIEVNNDNTVTGGAFSVLATDGTYTIDFRPPAASPYAPKTLFGVVATANVNLGTIVLGNYVTLSGTVTDSSNTPIADADIDVIDMSAQKAVFTPGDGTLPNGTYSARLAPGTWKLVFSPPATRQDLGSYTISSQSILANTVLNVTLPSALTCVTKWELY